MNQETKVSMGVKRKKKKVWIWTVAAILVFYVGVMSYIGNYFYHVSIDKDTKKTRDVLAEELKEGLITQEWLNSLQQEEFDVKSPNGYNLKGTLIKANKPTENTVILSHGIGHNRWQMLKYGKIYLDRGFNIVIYDLRNHGKSGGDNVTYGYYEKFDLQAEVNAVKDKYPNGILGLHGLSLGAATTMQEAGLNEKDKKVQFYVDDCGYSDMEQLFTYLLKHDYSLPNLGIVQWASGITKLRQNFWFDQVSPIHDIAKVSVPVLFIHGDQDVYVPTSMGKDMYTAKKIGMKELFIAHGSPHAENLKTQPKEYVNAVNHFLDEVLQP